MTLVTHAYPKLHHALGLKTINLTTDTLKVALYTSAVAYTWNAASQGHEFYSNFIAGSGAGALTEVSSSGTNYTTGGNTLTSVSISQATTFETLVVAANPSWPNATFTARYAVFYDSTPGTSATDPLLCYWDFGADTPVSGATFVLSIPTLNSVASALVQWSVS